MGSRPRTNRREPLQSKGFPCYFGVRASVSLTGSSTEDGSSNLGRKSNKSVGRRRDGEGGRGRGKRKRKKTNQRRNASNEQTSTSPFHFGPHRFSFDFYFGSSRFHRKKNTTSKASSHVIKIYTYFTNHGYFLYFTQIMLYVMKSQRKNGLSPKKYHPFL